MLVDLKQGSWKPRDVNGPRQFRPAPKLTVLPRTKTHQEGEA